MEKNTKTKREKQALSTDKCPRTWEKARRDRMKIIFNELSRLLPQFDPAEPPSRPQIIQKAIEHIRELQAQNEDLLKGGFDEVYKNRLETWKKRVKELVSRVEQLSEILRTADIHVPPLALESIPGWTKTRSKYWTNKLMIPEEQVEQIIQNLSQKSKAKCTANLKIRGKKRSLPSKENVESLNSDQISKKTLSCVKRLNKAKIRGRVVKNKVKNTSAVQENSDVTDDPVIKSTSITEPKAVLKSLPLLLPQSNVNSITTQGSVNQISAPRYPNLIQASPVAQSGTFFLTNQGSLVPVITPNVLTPLILNRPPPLLVVQTPVQPQLPVIVSRPPLNKRRIDRDSTVMTFSNKKPIPALSKQSHIRKTGKCLAHKNRCEGGQNHVSMPAVCNTIPAVSQTASLTSFPVVTTSLTEEKSQSNDPPQNQNRSPDETSVQRSNATVVPTKSLSANEKVSAADDTLVVFTINLPSSTEANNVSANQFKKVLEIEKMSVENNSLSKTLSESTSLQKEKEASYKSENANIKSPVKNENITNTQLNTKALFIDNDCPKGNGTADGSSVDRLKTSINSAPKLMAISSSQERQVSELSRSDETTVHFDGSKDNHESVKYSTSFNSAQPHNAVTVCKDSMEGTATDIPEKCNYTNVNSRKDRSKEPCELNSTTVPSMPSTEMIAVDSRKPSPIKTAVHSAAITVNPTSKSVLTAPLNSSLILSQNQNDEKIATTEIAPWASALPIMSTPSHIVKTNVLTSNSNQISNQVSCPSNWLPLPPIYSAPTSNWNSAQVFSEPWNMPTQSSNCSAACVTSNLQLSAGTTVNEPWTLEQTGNAAISLISESCSRSNKRKSGLNSSSWSPICQSPYSESDNKGTPIKGIEISTSIPVSFSSSERSQEKIVSAPKLSDSYIHTVKAPFAKVKSAHLPTLAESWNIPPTNTMQNMVNHNITKIDSSKIPNQSNSDEKARKPLTMSDKSFSSSAIGEPWKTPSFAQNQISDAHPWRTGTSSSCVPAIDPIVTTNTAFASDVAKASKNLAAEIKEPTSINYNALSIASSTRNLHQTMNCPIIVSSSSIRFENKSTVATMDTVADAWRPHSTYVPGPPPAPSSLAATQGQVFLNDAVPWRDPFPGTKIRDNPSAASFAAIPPVAAPPLPPSKSFPDALATYHPDALHPPHNFSRKNPSMINVTSAPVLNTSQTYAEAWNNQQTEPYTSVLHPYTQDDSRLNPSQTKQTNILCSYESLNEAPYFTTLTPSSNNSKNNDAIGLGSLESRASTLKNVSNNMIFTSSNTSVTRSSVETSVKSCSAVSYKQSLNSTGENSLSTKSGPAPEGLADFIKNTHVELYPPTASQAYEPSVFSTTYPITVSNIAPLTTPFPPPMPANSVVAAVNPVLNMESNIVTKGQKKEFYNSLTTISSVKSKVYEKNKDLARTINNSVNRSDCGRMAEKFNFPDTAGSLWNTQYLPSLTSSTQTDVIPWSQIDYSCSLDAHDTRPKQLVNWMTESQQKCDYNIPEDQIQFRSQNVFDRNKDNNLLDFLNNPLDHDNGKIRKKENDPISQDYFGWLSMKVDPLVVPSTLPTLVGDLALGSEPTPAKRNKLSQHNYPTESDKNVTSTIHMIQEPFTNLSKNIFDSTQNNGTKENSSTETIVLKNIFELPAAAPSKQRQGHGGQNSFLSVSQLVESHNEEVSPQKQSQVYTYYSQRSGKNKQGEWKCSEKKCQQSKSCSSNYSAEALLRNTETAVSEQVYPTHSAYGNDCSRNIQVNNPNITSVHDGKPNGGSARNRKHDYYRGQELKIDSSVPQKTRPSKKAQETPFSLSIISSSNQSLPQFNVPYGNIATSVPLIQPTGISVSNTSINPLNTLQATYNCSSSRKPYYPRSSGSLYPYPAVGNLKPVSVQSGGSILGSTTSYSKPSVPYYSTANSSGYQPLVQQQSLRVPPTQAISHSMINAPSVEISTILPQSFPSNSLSMCSVPVPTQVTVPIAPNRVSAGAAVPQKNSTTQKTAVPNLPTTNCPYPANTVHNPSLNASNSLMSTPITLPTYPAFPALPSQTPGTTGSSLANFNLTTIFPEMNKKGFQYS